MIRAPAADRNKGPILDVLKDIFIPKGEERPKVLEIASGTGQHIAHLASNLPHVDWTPSDVDNNYFSSIAAHIQHYGVKNVSEPVIIDASKPCEEWPSTVLDQRPWDAIMCINMIHITPFKCTQGLFQAAGKLLKPDTGRLITYGPYAMNGKLEPESNVRFDASLRGQDPEWGIRDIARQIVPLATANSLSLSQMIDMPANNKILIFRRLRDDSR